CRTRSSLPLKLEGRPSRIGGNDLFRAKPVPNDGASQQSATGGEQRRGQSALYRRQRRRRLYAQNAARASWEFRGSHGGERRERVRGGGGRAALYYPDGPRNARC